MVLRHFKGHFVVAVDKEGTVLQPANPQSCNTTGYGTCFMAEGIFEYYRATKDPKALPVALDALKAFQALMDDPTMTPDEVQYSSALQRAHTCQHI